MMPDSAGPPIFVVGVPRSGTTLLAALLAAHSRLACGPETGFFVALAGADVRRLLDPRAWPGRAVDFLGAMRLGGEPVPDRYGLSRAALEAYLGCRRPAVPVLLSALTELYMQRVGKVRWVEKTPSHLLQVAAIRRHFPRSPILRIVRDPRDVALSLLDVPWGVGSFLEGLLYWREFDEAGGRFFAEDRRSLTLRFEDLVAAPADVMMTVCRFLGEPFEGGMLDTAGSAVHVRRGNETWKAKVGAKIDPGRGAAWRGRLGPAELIEAVALVGDRIEAGGYPAGVDGVPDLRYVRVHPLRRPAIRHAELLRDLIGRGHRFWALGPGEGPVASYYLGTPGAPAWVGHRTAERLRTTARVAVQILRERAAGRPVFWQRDAAEPARIGRCGRLLARLLAGVPAVRPEAIEAHASS